VESIHWELAVEEAGARVQLRGRLDEHADLEPLAPEVARSRCARFDLAGVSAINSWGARSWILFLRGLPAAMEYSFVAASVPFVRHCNMVADMLGRGELESLTAPFACSRCHAGSERVLDTDAVARQLAVHRLPHYPCACGGEQQLDDVPERYFAFLRLR
jgi:hypothetical protein